MPCSSILQMRKGTHTWCKKRSLNTANTVVNMRRWVHPFLLLWAAVGEGVVVVAVVWSSWQSLLHIIYSPAIHCWKFSTVPTFPHLHPSKFKTQSSLHSPDTFQMGKLCSLFLIALYSWNNTIEWQLLNLWTLQNKLNKAQPSTTQSIILLPSEKRIKCCFYLTRIKYHTGRIGLCLSRKRKNTWRILPSRSRGQACSLRPPHCQRFFHLISSKTPHGRPDYAEKGTVSQIVLLRRAQNVRSRWLFK